MADLWYNAPPPPPLASFNPDAAVLTIGSAGESLLGGLRIGWIRASARTIASLIQAAIRWIWVRRCWSNWPAAGYWKMPPHCCRRGGNMLKARRDMCETLMAEYFPRWRFRHRKVGSLFKVELPDMLATPVLCACGKPRGSISAPVRGLGLEGAFDRYLRLPFTLPDEACAPGLLHAHNRCGKALLNKKENTRLTKNNIRK